MAQDRGHHLAVAHTVMNFRVSSVAADLLTC